MESTIRRIRRVLYPVIFTNRWRFAYSMRYLLIVSASERQQIAALATQEFLSRADIWRTAAKQYVEARETRAVSHAHES
jgi:hypothetical protein